MTLQPFVSDVSTTTEEDAAKLEALNDLIANFIKQWGPKGDDYALAQFSAHVVAMVHRMYLLAAHEQAKVIADGIAKRTTFGFTR